MSGQARSRPAPAESALAERASAAASATGKRRPPRARQSSQAAVASVAHTASSTPMNHRQDRAAVSRQAIGWVSAFTANANAIPPSAPSRERSASAYTGASSASVSRNAASQLIGRILPKLAAMEDAVIAALDGARAAILARLGRWPAVATYRRARGLRLVVVASATVLAAFVLAVGAPLSVLALSPILLGVPHVASDVRYLLARPREGARMPPRALGPVLALFLLSIALGLGGAARLAAGAGAAAVAWAALAVPATGRARFCFTAGLAAAAAVAIAHPTEAGMVMAQGHNLLAIALAGWLARRQLRAGWLPAALVLAGAAAIGAGACDGWLIAPGPAFAETAWRETLAAVAPAGIHPTAARRWVAIFAFTQAAHYGAWIHVVPDALRAGERPPSFRRSFALLRAELGAVGARAAVAASLLVPAAALLSLDGARHAYLGFAVFHAYLELACVSVLVLARFPP
jgi:hypothetical protein